MVSFPMHLEQIEVHVIRCIRFRIPECEVRRNDVHIVAEYGISPDNPAKYRVFAWCHIGNADIRGLVHIIEVNKKETESETIDEIISALNISDEFNIQLQDYVSWFHCQFEHEEYEEE